jgi:hypothetical protein
VLIIACRKRRIKCGEERPTCQNCTKSKRQCEGYNQRVVFKDPLNAYRPSLSASFSGHSSGPSVPRHGAPQQRSAIQNPLPIAPKLPGPREPSFKTLDMAATAGLPPATSPGAERRQYTFQSGVKDTSPRNRFPPQSQQPIEIKFDTVDQSHLPEPNNRPHGQEKVTHYDFNALVNEERRGDNLTTPARTTLPDLSAGSKSASNFSSSRAST